MKPGQSIQYGLRFLRHALAVKYPKSISDPWARRISEALCYPTVPENAMRRIESLRDELLSSNEQLTVTDFGAGSRVFREPIRPVARMAHVVLKAKHEARSLYGLVDAVQPKVMLELGTSFGITSLYLAAAAQSGTLMTLEGDPATAAIAKRVFHSSKTKNIKLFEGTFEDSLPIVLPAIPRLDVVFFDGNHQKEPTLRYFELCLTKIHDHTVFVFDDINWSQEMAEAWIQIKAHPAVKATVDAFVFGIVLFSPTRRKRHFTIRL